MFDPRPLAGPGDDLVQPRRAERLPAARTLQHHEHVTVTRRGRPLRLQIAGEGGEKPLRDRNDPLVPALAVSDEQTMLTRLYVLQAQAEDLAAAQTTQQHCLDHRKVQAGPQRGREGIDLVRVDHPRKSPRRPNQRDAAHRSLSGTPHCQPARHRVAGHASVVADDQILIQASNRRQPTLNRARRQPRFAVLDPHHLQTQPGSALSLDERQNVGGVDRDRVLADDRKEHLQVVGRRQHRVRSRSRRHQLQVLVKQPVTQGDNRPARGTMTLNQTWNEHHRPPRPRVPPSRGPHRLTRRDHPHIVTRSGTGSAGVQPGDGGGGGLGS